MSSIVSQSVDALYTSLPTNSWVVPMLIAPAEGNILVGAVDCGTGLLDSVTDDVGNAWTILTIVTTGPAPLALIACETVTAPTFVTFAFDSNTTGAAAKIIEVSGINTIMDSMEQSVGGPAESITLGPSDSTLPINDALLAAVVTDGPASSFIPPSGWTIANAALPNGSSNLMFAYNTGTDFQGTWDWGNVCMYAAAMFTMEGA